MIYPSRVTSSLERLVLAVMRMPPPDADETWRRGNRDEFTLQKTRIDAAANDMNLGPILDIAKPKELTSAEVADGELCDPVSVDVGDHGWCAGWLEQHHWWHERQLLRRGDGVAHTLEHHLDRAVRRFDMLQKRRGERAVRISAVLGYPARIGGVGDEQLSLL